MDPEKPMKALPNDLGTAVFAILVLILALVLGHTVFFPR
jgi:hypothetical protein